MQEHIGTVRTLLCQTPDGPTHTIRRIYGVRECPPGIPKLGRDLVQVLVPFLGHDLVWVNHDRVDVVLHRPEDRTAK